MLHKELPKPDEIDLTGISDPAIARKVVGRLLSDFKGIPRAEKYEALYSQNRTEFIDGIREAILTEFLRARRKGEGHTIGNLSVEANVIADAVLGALSEVYPRQLQ